MDGTLYIWFSVDYTIHYQPTTMIIRVIIVGHIIFVVKPSSLMFIIVGQMI